MTRRPACTSQALPRSQGGRLCLLALICAGEGGGEPQLCPPAVTGRQGVLPGEGSQRGLDWPRGAGSLSRAARGLRALLHASAGAPLPAHQNCVPVGEDSPGPASCRGGGGAQAPHTYPAPPFCFFIPSVTASIGHEPGMSQTPDPGPLKSSG